MPQVVGIKMCLATNSIDYFLKICYNTNIKGGN